MSETKHTPGPWKAQDWSGMTLITPDKLPVSGAVAYIYGKDTEQEAQANAALIASAPDLAARVAELEGEKNTAWFGFQHQFSKGRKCDSEGGHYIKGFVDFAQKGGLHCPMCLAARVAELEGENKRLREALEMIASGGVTGGHSHRFARAALAQPEPERSTK